MDRATDIRLNCHAVSHNDAGVSSAKLRELVKSERQRRGWSARTAATKSGQIVSNTTWSRYENGDGELTGKVQRAVAAAFGWPSNWLEPEIATTLDQPATEAGLLERLDRLVEQVEALTERVTEQGAEIARLRHGDAEAGS